MHLYFLRHGNADRSEWTGSDDRKRPLTRKGMEKLERQAQRLKDIGFAPSLILTSPLDRAAQTAEIVARVLGKGVPVKVEPALAPGFGPAELTVLLARYEAFEDILLVGHEPDFSETISAVVGGGRVQVKKGALACVDLSEVKPPSGSLELLIPPKMLLGE